MPSGESQSVAGGDEDALDEYQELSTREEQDIESMMETCEYAISNAEAFTEQLSRELQVLDGVSRTPVLQNTRVFSYFSSFNSTFSNYSSSLRPISSPSWLQRSRSTF